MNIKYKKIHKDIYSYIPGKSVNSLVLEKDTDLTAFMQQPQKNRETNFFFKTGCF